MVKPTPLVVLPPSQLNSLTITDFAATVVKNYGVCRSDQARLDELQKWVVGEMTK